MGKHKRHIQMVILAALIILGGVTVARALFNGSGIPEKGDKAPSFTVKGLDGETHERKDLDGKPVVLNFWGTFCPPCTEEMPALQKQADRWASEGVSVIGMNLAENAVTVNSFLTQYGIRFPIYMDADETVRKAYGVHQYPTTFFIKPDGRIFEIKVGKMDENYIEQTVTALLAAS
jgi:peroxiredoxin